MYRCPKCNFEARTVVALGGHMLEKHGLHGSKFLEMIAKGEIKDKIDVNKPMCE